MKTQQLVYADLIDKRFKISIGSGYTGGIWNEETLLRELKNGIFASKFDFDFYYNYLDFEERNQYQQTFIRLVVTPALNNIHESFVDYFRWETRWYVTPEPILCLVSDSFRQARRNHITEWVMHCPELSADIKKCYADYRKSYAGEDIAIAI